MPYGGNPEMQCTRAKEPRREHQFPVLESGKLGGYAARIADVLKMRGEEDSFMIGLLSVELASRDRTVIQLVTASGRWSREHPLPITPEIIAKAAVGNRDMRNFVPMDYTPYTRDNPAPYDVPRNEGAQWIDIYGRPFTMRTNLKPRDESRPCAATQLLLWLGTSDVVKAGRFEYKSILLYEESFKGTDPERARELRGWLGEYLGERYKAHSCNACVERLPLLLCSHGVRDL